MNHRSSRSRYACDRTSAYKINEFRLEPASSIINAPSPRASVLILSASTRHHRRHPFTSHRVTMATHRATPGSEQGIAFLGNVHQLVSPLAQLMSRPRVPVGVQVFAILVHGSIADSLYSPLLVAASSTPSLSSTCSKQSASCLTRAG